MNLGDEIGAQRLMHETVTGKSGQALKAVRDEADGEMRLAPFPPAGMAAMALGFIPDLQNPRAEGGLKP